MRSSFGRDSSDGYCVAFAQSLGHVLIAYTPVGLYAGSLSRPRLMPETSVIPAYSKFGDRNFAPNGAKREARFSGAALRAHAVVSPLNLSAEFSLLLFCLAKEKQRNPALCLPLMVRACRLTTLPPLMVRGGVTKCGGIRKPALRKNSESEANPQASRKGRVK